MNTWDKRVRGAFLAMVVIFPWAWLFLPPVSLKYLSFAFLLPAAYGLYRWKVKMAEERKAWEARLIENRENRAKEYSRARGY